MWSVHFSKIYINAVFLYYLLNWHLPGYSFLVFSLISRMALWMAMFVSPQLCPNWIISRALGWIAIKLSWPLAATLSISVFPVFPWVLFIILTCLTSLTHISSSRHSSSHREDERERDVRKRCKEGSCGCLMRNPSFHTISLRRCQLSMCCASISPYLTSISKC